MSSTLCRGGYGNEWMLMNRIQIFDLSSSILPRRVREQRTKNRLATQVGRMDPSRSLQLDERRETAWMKRLRAAEEERRRKLEED